jgi:hypothetical protein
MGVVLVRYMPKFRMALPDVVRAAMVGVYTPTGRYTSCWMVPPGARFHCPLLYVAFALGVQDDEDEKPGSETTQD